MQRDIWTREDLRNALVAAFYAGVEAPKDLSDERQWSYNQGFSAALATLALNFGLGTFPPPQRRAPSQPVTDPARQTRVISR